MKTTHALLATVLAIALTLPVFGQETRGEKAGTEMRHRDMSSMLGKPTVDATVEGLHMKIWLMTQKQHKELMKGRMGQMMMRGEEGGAMGRMGMKDTSMGMGKEMKGMKDTSMGMGKEMKGMKHDGMGMNKAMMDSMMAGTHHIMLEVTDVSLGKEIADASAKVLIVSPSKYNATVDLKPMRGHFGGALTLSEKGKYQIAVSVNVNGVSKTKEFEYSMK
jgi:predicted  nucleic acid-binding Zn-ribbon protein